LALTLALALVLGQQLEPITASLDHRDQWGVLAQAGVSVPSVIRENDTYNANIVATLEVGGSFGIGDLSELQLRVRLVDDPRLRPWVLGGYHGYTSEGPLTTTYGVDVVGVTGHDWGFGARVSAGFQWDPVRWGGLMLLVGFAASDGASLMLTFDGLFGGQLRF
jgi:hypothetical protein